MSATNTIEQLQLKATFSQDTLNKALEAVKRGYESSQQHVFTTPQQMVEGLQTLFQEGWNTGSTYTHHFVQPSYFAVYLVKPLSLQQDELAKAFASAEAAYRAEVEQAKEQLIQALAEQRVAELERLEWAKAQAKKEKQLEQALKEVRSRLEGA
ncbi:hypothetical protein ACQKFE_08125 [Stutzerimonas stutzeri]|uniref:hypothetical protein n=1 Tax=Stutzerimonas stutzeri TaxID=316 RepID=UPI003CFF5D0A